MSESLSRKRRNENDESIDEQHDIETKKKREESNNESMMNYADQLIDLIRKNESSDIIFEFLERYPIASEQIGGDGYCYPLHAACCDMRCGNIVRMKLIDLYPLAVTKPDKDGYYPLHIACCLHNTGNEFIMKLIEIFPDAAKSSSNISNCFPLNRAMVNCIQYHTIIIPLIELNPKALQKKDHSGRYPIHNAILKNLSNHIIQHILNVDPLSITRQNRDGSSPLHMKYPERLSNILMESMVYYSDILINMKDNYGRTPLHFACMFEKDDVVEFLLQYPGIDANAKDMKNRSTPLHRCVSSGPSINIVRKLLDHPRIIYNDMNSANETPLECAKKEIQRIEKYNNIGNTHYQKKLLEIKEIKKLLEDFPVKRRWKAFNYLLKSNDMEL